ncbi:ABC transporter ATP-binding protein [Streptomyces spongiae]|uniref:ABC transporter ATP-binding protein n=1 Tax=Streptomyces spongiae TaxID=565072 RepID=A0A5N8XKJ7_9ACTN|nr:ABC transporter ATP-binding protein [Streptomyces spongiae]
MRKTFQPRSLLKIGQPVLAVDGVSLALPAGSTLAVVGESGSGKTTLARMIMGVETPTSGSIEFFGRAQPRRMRTRDRRAHARVIQMVFQNPYRSLDPRQSVGAAIDEVLRLHFDLGRQDSRARTAELFDLVRLSPTRLDALPRELSGGQRQRVCIARALATNPRAIILDEAVAALDVLVQAQVLNLLADVQEQTDVSYLFVTHDLAVVRQIADDVLVMWSGRVVEHGCAEEVLDHPEHPYTRLLRDSVPRPGWKPARRLMDDGPASPEHA